MVVDTALERAEAELFNTISTTAWELRSGNWLVCKSELESARLITRPLTSLVVGCVCSEPDELLLGDRCAGAGRDGVCDDGGPGSDYSVCQLGSDCSDCGPRAAPEEVFAAPAGTDYGQLLRNASGINLVTMQVTHLPTRPHPQPLLGRSAFSGANQIVG
jgi:hypothetical protein